MKFVKLKDNKVIEISEADTFNDFLKLNNFVPADDLTDEQKQECEAIEKANEYVEPSAEQNKIEELKAQLSATDYKCLKYIDGALTEEEYAEVRAYRAELRRQINELEIICMTEKEK